MNKPLVDRGIIRFWTVPISNASEGSMPQAHSDRSIFVLPAPGKPRIVGRHPTSLAPVFLRFTCDRCAKRNANVGMTPISTIAGGFQKQGTKAWVHEPSLLSAPASSGDATAVWGRKTLQERAPRGTYAARDSMLDADPPWIERVLNLWNPEAHLKCYALGKANHVPNLLVAPEPLPLSRQSWTFQPPACSPS